MIMKKKIFALGDAMKVKGWDLNIILNPAGIHVCLTHNHIDKGDKFIKDLSESIQNVIKFPEKYKESIGIYGTMMSIPSTAPIDQFVTGFLNAIGEV